MEFQSSHVEKSLNALIKSVAKQDDMDEDDLEELVRTPLLLTYHLFSILPHNCSYDIYS